MMDQRTRELIDRLEENHSLGLEEYRYLVEHNSLEARDYIAPRARKVSEEIYGREVYVRGLIEFSNYCMRGCFYCGIRGSNRKCERYRLSPDEILECCEAGYSWGYRTFVLQSGEDMFYTDDMVCDILKCIKNRYPDCAVTLSMGEKSRESYQRYYDAGGDRYLLRHETADSLHYSMLHPGNMHLESRMKCLQDLRDVGFAVGVGMMIGSPWQKPENLAKDLKFIEEFRPEMCGMGPFIPHEDTPFKNFEPGTLEMSLYLLSIVKLIHPQILLPATTALETIHPGAREMGVLAGANVVMPNISPMDVRKKYLLYNNKIGTEDDPSLSRDSLTGRMAAIGYKTVVSRGDPKVKQFL